MNSDATAAPRNSSGDTDVFYYTFADSDEKKLDQRAKILLTLFITVVTVPTLVGVWFSLFGPLAVSGGGTARGVLIGIVCITPALLSLPLLRRKIIGSYSSGVSTRIISEMGEDDAFSSPLNEVLMRTPWSTYRVALYGGYRDKPEDITICLTDGRSMELRFNDTPLSVILTRLK